MVRYRLVIRTAYAEIPPKVEYELSQAGIDLMPTFDALREWSLKYEGQLAGGPSADDPASGASQ